MKRISVAVGLCIALSALASPALAAPCRDAKGKFVTCPVAKKQPCRDAKGKFTACPAATTEPK